MAPAGSLLLSLVRAGLDLALDAERRVIVRPASALTEPQREQIRQHRDDLADLLDFDDDERRRCTSCRGYRGTTCPRPARSGIAEPGADLAVLLQRCHGFHLR